ncbi:MAG: DoxX family protein [Methanobacteriota archaeon]|nr:MAG: DoxX family protein [Euryarchaeota archaeon]
MAYNEIFLVGRIIAGFMFIMFGLNHFMKLEMLSGYAGSKGVPAPKLAVIGSGLLLLIGGISFLIGFQPLIGTIALALFFIGVTPMMHNFWKVEDEQMKMAEMTHFMKNMTILGLVLMILFTVDIEWPFAI